MRRQDKPPYPLRKWQIDYSPSQVRIMLDARAGVRGDDLKRPFSALSAFSQRAVRAMLNHSEFKHYRKPRGWNGDKASAFWTEITALANTKKNPKRGKRFIPSAKSRKRAKAKRAFRPVRRLLKGAKLKPRRKHAVAKRKREQWIICAEHENRRTKYYWTGKNFDTDSAKAQHFPSLIAAREFARGIVKRLPPVIAQLEIKRG